MRLERLLRYLLIAGIFSTIFVTTNQAEAISLSPLTFELAVNPGEVVTNVLKITNTDAVPVNVTIKTEDFAAIGEEGQVTLEEPTEDLTFSSARWVTANPSVLVLLPNESATIEFVISVPANAEPGGHYSSILATVSAAATQGGGSSIAQQVGSLILINVAGDVTENLRIEEFFAAGYSEYGPVGIISRFENDGTVHLKPRGFILIKNIFGKEIAKLDLPQRNVLPRSIRRIEVPWGEKIMFGRYEATLTAIYGSTNQPLSSVTSFWVIPWKITTAVAIGLIALLSFFIKGRKRIRLALSVLFRGTHRLQGLN